MAVIQEINAIYVNYSYPNIVQDIDFLAVRLKVQVRVSLD